MQNNSETEGESIAAFPAPVQKRLTINRDLIKSQAPDAKEKSDMASHITP
jgi:hypothetical protein